MPDVCRIGDLGVGVCHLHDHPRSFVTTFVSADPIVDVNGRQMMRVGDIGVTSCGHRTIATTGSGTVVGSNGLPVHRVGDVGIVEGGGGVYVAITGSHDTEAGG